MITVNKDMVIYNDLAQTKYLERIRDNLNVFNQNSNGAIQLINERVVGDFKRRAFYTAAGDIVDRDVNSQEEVSFTALGSGEQVGVKYPWKYEPVAATIESFSRRAQSIEDFSMIVGAHLADVSMKFQIRLAFGALKAAIKGNPTMITKTSIANKGRKVITQGLRKFGDNFGNITMLGMNSGVYFDLVDDAMGQKLYGEIGTVLYGGAPGTLGLPVVVSDQIDPDEIFGLQPNAVTVTESQPPVSRFFDINNLENLGIGFRTEGTHNIELLGYSWKDGAGANPTMAALTSSQNWRKHAKSDKATAGFLLDLTEAAV